MHLQTSPFTAHMEQLYVFLGRLFPILALFILAQRFILNSIFRAYLSGDLKFSCLGWLW